MNLSMKKTKKSNTFTLVLGASFVIFVFAAGTGMLYMKGVSITDSNDITTQIEQRVGQLG